MKKFNSIHEIANFIVGTISKDNVHGVYIITNDKDKLLFNSKEDIENEMNKMEKDIKNGSIVIYLGGKVTGKNDISYAHEYLSKIRKDLTFIMIQIKELEQEGIPAFVNGVYFHDDYNTNDTKRKFGGFEEINGKYKVYSNTKQWIKLHFLLNEIMKKDCYGKKKCGVGISFYFMVDNKEGEITSQEIKILDNLNTYKNMTQELNYTDVWFYPEKKFTEEEKQKFIKLSNKK